MKLCPSCYAWREDPKAPCAECGFSWQPRTRRPAVVGLGMAAVGLAALGWLILGGGPREVWSMRARRIVTSPLVAGERVLCATSDHRLHAAKKATGEVIWSRATDATYVADDLVASRDLLFFVDGHKVLRAVRLDDGSEVWSYRTRRTLSAPVLVGDRLVVGDGGLLRFFEAATGTGVDAIEIDLDHALGTPTLDGDRVYCGFSEPGEQRLYAGMPQEIPGGVYAIDLASREVLWRSELSFHVRHAPQLRDGLLHVVEHSGARASTYALDAATGELVWRRAGAETGVTLAGRLACHGHLQRGAGLGVFRAFDRRTGGPVWEYAFSLDLPAHMQSRQIEPRLSDATASDSRLFFGCLNELHCLDLRTGQRLWRWRLTGRILHRPALAGDRLFVATTGRLYALAVD